MFYNNPDEGINKVKSNHIISCFFIIFLLLAVPGCLNDKDQEEKIGSELMSDKEHVIILVNDAVDLIEENKEAAFSQFREPNSKWFHDDFFVFVWTIDGVQVVYPPDFRKEGQDMNEFEDTKGNQIGKRIIDIALNASGGDWVSYEWPKPGELNPSRSYTFIQKAESNGQIYVVGSTFYIEY